MCFWRACFRHALELKVLFLHYFILFLVYFPNFYLACKNITFTNWNIQLTKLTGRIYLHYRILSCLLHFSRLRITLFWQQAAVTEDKCFYINSWGSTSREDGMREGDKFIASGGFYCRKSWWRETVILGNFIVSII